MNSIGENRLKELEAYFDDVLKRQWTLDEWQMTAHALLREVRRLQVGQDQAAGAKAVWAERITTAAMAWWDTLPEDATFDNGPLGDLVFTCSRYDAQVRQLAAPVQATDGGGA